MSHLPHKNNDLHGFVPDSSPWALLIVDMVTDLSFAKNSKQLLKRAFPIAKRISALKTTVKKRRVPVIYANDNFGRWQSDFRGLVEHCSHESSPGRPLVEQLWPEEDDYFVLKPKHSAFFSTTLETLLKYLGTKKVILTGMTANQCILFTANDAHMRDFDIFIPRDCVAAGDAERLKAAFVHFEEVLGVDTRPAAKLARRLSCR